MSVTAVAVAAPVKLAGPASLQITRTAALFEATPLFEAERATILVPVVLVVLAVEFRQPLVIVARIIPQQQLRQQQEDPIPAAPSIPIKKTQR